MHTHAFDVKRPRFPDRRFSTFQKLTKRRVLGATDKSLQVGFATKLSYDCDELSLSAFDPTLESGRLNEWTCFEQRSNA